MAQIGHHGGGCCGLRHIFNFSGRETAEELKALVNGYIDGYGYRVVRQGRVRGMLVEAALTNNQLNRNPELGAALHEAGFELVSRTANINTGNIINIFHSRGPGHRDFTRLPRGVVRP